MPGPGMRVHVGDAAGREVDPVAAREPLRGRVEVDLAREERAPASSSSSSQTSACPSTFAAPKNGSLRATS